MHNHCAHPPLPQFHATVELGLDVPPPLLVKPAKAPRKKRAAAAAAAGGADSDGTAAAAAAAAGGAAAPPPRRSTRAHRAMTRFGDGGADDVVSEAAREAAEAAARVKAERAERAAAAARAAARVARAGGAGAGAAAAGSGAPRADEAAAMAHLKKNLERLSYMSDDALKLRARRITNISKLVSFIEARGPLRCGCGCVASAGLACARVLFCFCRGFVACLHYKCRGVWGTGAISLCRTTLRPPRQPTDQ